MDSGTLGLEKPENKGGSVLFDDNAQKEGRKDNVVLHFTGTSHMRAGGYEEFERKKGIKENEVERWCIASTGAH